jgi:uncharacterized membrane protein YhaH (DUF805 family)
VDLLVVYLHNRSAEAAGRLLLLATNSRSRRHFHPFQTEINPRSPTVSFTEAIRVCLNKYVTFSGRARRSEFWFWVLFSVCTGVVAGIIDMIVGSSIVTYAAALGLFLPGLAVTIRRLHDTTRSGWFYLLSLVPFGGFVVLYFALQDSTPADNAYGASPK